MNLERLTKWLEEAEVGDRVMYLQADWAGRKKDVTDLMMAAAENGKVVLTQKKMGEGVYNYYATRCSEKTGKKLRPMDWRV